MEWTPGPREASRLMRILHRREAQSISTLCQPDGSFTTPGRETVDLLFQAHFPHSSPHRLPHYDHTPSLTSTIMAHFQDIVTADTIKDAMAHFQSKKTPGSDGFKPVLLLYLPPNILQVLCVIYRSCLFLRYTPRLWGVYSDLFTKARQHILPSLLILSHFPLQLSSEDLGTTVCLAR